MSAHNPTLARAFMRWIATAGQDLLAEVTVRQHRHRIDIRFRRLPELRGSIRKNALTVAAYRNRAYWGRVFRFEVEPVHDRRGWSCRENPDQVVYASRQALWIDQLFVNFRDWVVGPLREANCIEYIIFGSFKAARLQPDQEVPYRIAWEHERYWKRRAEAAATATRRQLALLDIQHSRFIAELWDDFRTPVDYDQLEREALASLGPEGIEYLNNLTDDDFTPFDVDEIRRRLVNRKE